MKKREYLDRLGKLLACLPADQRAESLAFYEETIDDRIEEGMTEEEAVAALESPGVAAERILDDLPAVPRAVAKTRRKSRVLLWVLAIVGSPIWLSLAVAFAVIAVSIYATIWILAICIWVIAAALVLAFPFSLLLALWGVVAGNGAYVLVQLGMGLVGLALGLLCFKGALAATRQLARLSRVWLEKMRSPFIKNRKDKDKQDGTNGGTGSAGRSVDDVALEQARLISAEEGPTGPCAAI